MSHGDVAANMWAYRNGERLRFADLAVPVTDSGFVQGLTVAEQLRTFRGELFRLDSHLQRLSQSLEIVGVDLPISMSSLSDAALQLVQDNYAMLPEGADLGLCIFVTPGPYGAYAWETPGPLLVMHATPLAFHTWADKYDAGQSLSTVSVRQVPVECWPAALKCRSRMHYFLADREARGKDPDSRALLLDLEGRVMEASTANVVFFFANEGLVSPPVECILPGISVAAMREIAEDAGLQWTHRHLSPDEILKADEVLLCSTSVCALPVLKIDGSTIGAGSPGIVYQQIMAEWSNRVGLDIRDQALRQSSLR